tara:strand:+ start:7136 stop:8113 length:978 start_codon:yes stop_codon:yes gene_type:complete
MNSIGYTHLLAFLLHITSAILAFMAMPESGLQLGKLVVPEVDYKVITTFNETNNMSSTSLQISETDHIVFEDINVVGLIFTNELITALSHLAGVIGFFLFKDAMMADGRHLESVRRYVEYAITAGLLEVALLVGMGSDNFYQVLFILLTNAAIQLMGYMSERTQDRMRQIYYSIGGFMLLAPAITIIVWNATLVDGMDRVRELAYFYTALYLLFGLHNLFDHLFAFWRNSIDRDTGYNILSVATKIGLSWLLIAIIFKTYEDAGVVLDPVVDMDFVALQDGLRYGIIGFVVVGLGLTAFVLPKPGGLPVAATAAEQQGLMMKTIP